MSSKFEEMIGVASSVFPGELNKNIKAVELAGFKTIEILAGDFSKKATIWPRTCGVEERKEIKRQLKSFSSVLVHASYEGVNICSINHGQREESVKQYLECIEFAHDIGAKIVSFHPGTQTPGNFANSKEIVNYNIEFGKRALEKAYEYDLELTFETVNISLPDIKEIINNINDSRFGLNLNCGAIAKTIDLTADDIASTQKILKWMNQFKRKIVVIHISGVHQRWHLNRLDLCPLEMNNCINYFPIIKKLRQSQYKGPVVLEIIARDADSVIRYCQSAREKLLFYRDRSEGKR